MTRRLLALLVVAGLAGAGAWALFFRDGDAQPTPGLGEPALDHFGLDSDTFRQRFNQAVTHQVEEDTLRRPVWRPDETLGLETADQGIEDWGLIELYRDSDGLITAAYVLARPANDDHQRRFAAVASAAIAASLGIGSNEARGILTEELRLHDLDDRPPSVVVDQGGVRLDLARSSEAWQLTITSSQPSVP